MGLELVAYKNLDDGIPVAEWEEAHPGEDPCYIDGHIYLEDDGLRPTWEELYPGYMGRFVEGLVYEPTVNSVPVDYEDTYSMGAYSSYNGFKSLLDEFNARAGSGALAKLIAFPDDSGIIGTELAAEMNDEFTRLREDWLAFIEDEFSYEPEDEYDDGGTEAIARYAFYWDDWIAATRIARENGAIQFA